MENMVGLAKNMYLNHLILQEKKAQIAYKVKKSLKVRAVAYSSGTHTALGTKLRYGVIAVDPKVIPYRTKVYIKELDRVFVAEDCGGGIKGKIIDIYMPSEAQCNRWGSRNITIQILK